MDGGDCNIPDAFLKKRGDKNKIQCNDWLLRKHSIIELYFELETVLKFYSLEVRIKTNRYTSDDKRRR